MKNEKGEEADHLGDGAYVTFTGYSYVLTANHHDPAEATDQVHLEPSALAALLRFIKRIDPGLLKKVNQE